MWLLVAWLACAVGAAGFIYASLEHIYSEPREHLGFALCIGLLGGPISFVLGFMLTGFGHHGWRLR